MTDAELGAVVRRIASGKNFVVVGNGRERWISWWAGQDKLLLTKPLPTLDDALRAALAALDKDKE